MQADLDREGELMGEYTKWCDAEANDKEDAITSARRLGGHARNRVV